MKWSESEASIGRVLAIEVSAHSPYFIIWYIIGSFVLYNARGIYPLAILVKIAQIEYKFLFYNLTGVT